MSLFESANKRPFALKVIIAYKLIKAPLMLCLALWLMLMPEDALHEASSIAEELVEGGNVWSHVGQWLSSQLSASVLSKAAILSLLDGLISAMEAIVLLTGRLWGEWLVILGIAALIPFELFSLVHRFSGTKIFVIVVNILMVAYLAHRRAALAHGERST